MVWCWRRREMECRPMTVPWNNGMFVWFVTQDSDTLRRFASWWYVMLVWLLCEHSSFMMAFWPLSQIRRLCVQLVGVLRLRCPHGVFMFLGGSCWRVLMRGRAFQLPNCRVWCCAIFWLLQYFLMRESSCFFATQFIWWYFMFLGPLREFLMRYHAFRPWWDVMRFPHDIWCFVWPPQWDCYAFTSWDVVLFLLHTFRVRLPHEMDFVMRFHIVEGSRKIVLWDVILVDPPTRFPRSILLLFAA